MLLALVRTARKHPPPVLRPAVLPAMARVFRPSAAPARRARLTVVRRRCSRLWRQERVPRTDSPHALRASAPHRPLRSPGLLCPAELRLRLRRATQRAVSRAAFAPIPAQARARGLAVGEPLLRALPPES